MAPDLERTVFVVLPRERSTAMRLPINRSAGKTRKIPRYCAVPGNEMADRNGWNHLAAFPFVIELVRLPEELSL